MSSLRFQALQDILDREPLMKEEESMSRAELFGTNVFNRSAMKKNLSSDIFKKVIEAIEGGRRLDRSIAGQVATGMRTWAMAKGATHYTHWFQPLTGLTAEKHDAFFETTSDGEAIDHFGGAQLSQQEPDASSFPNGGIRNTFEARGYTAWDPTSPAFVMGSTLCIPTVFVAYTGEALDYKTPLLKTITAIDKAATDVCQYFDKKVTKVITTLGWEQEYFLVDYALVNARPDLILTGRTLFGHLSSKGQQLDDHYFGSIPERAKAFMEEFEFESIKLGIPVKTRHNEVAPNQFECAPIFEELNLAVDHNQLVMDVMEKVARKHKFKALLHEKPFANVNGSGKHNNWSLATNLGDNLLSPGNTPKSNIRFLTFFVNTIKAVHEYNDLIRASIASAGNDHRLGANEAPPAIISVFIGTELSAVLDVVEKRVTGDKMNTDDKTDLKLDIGKIPSILLDNTDRNRTSPFAFTGNKFELRAVGSQANCSSSMIVLNTIVAKQLQEFKKSVDGHIAKGVKKDEAVFKILKKYIVESKSIRFEGNGYGDEWEKEAKKRGLSNIKTTPHALDVFILDKTKKLFKDLDILSGVELDARHEIELENYKLKIQIESRMIGDLALNQIIPTAIEYQNTLVSNVNGLKNIMGSKFKKTAGSQLNTIEMISEHITGIEKNVSLMVDARRKLNKIDDGAKSARGYCEKVVPFFDAIRRDVDKLEIIVDDKIWPLPKYREMLFTK
ncbi:MAG: glutamine synthetase III [Flavobacteriales bacterium]|nr:glutamine synthetase III [Flavobacteriales bacterium]